MIEWSDKYNPFNGYKTFIHTKYWEPIKNGIIPSPIYVSLDPCGVCNINCHFCNSKKEMSNNKYSKEMIDKIINLLKEWNTKAVCIGGGGEPYLNLNVNYLLKLLNENKIQVGTITNGTNLNPFIEELLKVMWIGVSVDASNEEEYKRVKGGNAKQFNNIINSIQLLKKNKGEQRFPELEFKYLITNKNYSSIYNAIKLAKDIGCDYIHIRPGATPWFEKENKDFLFTDNMLNIVNEQLQKAKDNFEDNGFKIFSVKYKFTEKFIPIKSFNSCYAGFTTCHILPNGDIGSCPCKRGDDNLILGNIDNIKNIWGSKKHIDIINNIDVDKCPNCTYITINEMFENIILEDKMNYNFI